MASAAVLAVAPAAQASIDAFGNVHGRDHRVLVRQFKARHRSGYVVRGMHASILFRFRYAGVYFLRRAHGVNVSSGVAVFKHNGSRWRPMGHLSRKLRANMQPDAWRYGISITGGGEFKRNEVSGADDPTTTTTGTTDINLTLAGGYGLRGEGVEIVRGQEQPGPDPPKMLLGGSGSSQYTDAGNPANNYSCTVTLEAPDLDPEIGVVWRHGHFATFVNTSRPAENSSVENCGAQVEDPGADTSGIETTITPPATPPLGRPFTLPLSIHHATHDGDASDYTDESLSLDGTLAFRLRDVEVPDLN